MAMRTARHSPAPWTIEGFSFLADSEGKLIATLAPDVPTMQESGLPGFIVSSGFSFLGPAGIPRPVVEKLNSALVKSLQDPANRKELLNRGAVPVGNTPEQHAAYIKAEIEKWRKVAQGAGIKPE